MTYTTAVKEFSDACNDGNLPTTPKLMSVEAVEFIAEMVNDELEELREATDVVEQSDALVDAIYYICDTAVRHGMNLDRVFEIVHGANMGKVVDGRVIRRDDGKILKPEGWRDPGPLLITELERQQREGSWV
ncbi:MAG: HAD family hydrolase [Acidimicrobiaceae bacterium]|nr:HAD family hydrolase [Acidimicrobiaceae bacterium]MYD05485.1 HAD family hydrolase [Acidimicrobiaceae bacterium]MYI57117.1 HAD family hydrolase [Acidimicrobiaceae bacterium]